MKSNSCANFLLNFIRKENNNNLSNIKEVNANEDDQNSIANSSLAEINILTQSQDDSSDSSNPDRIEEIQISQTAIFPLNDPCYGKMTAHEIKELVEEDMDPAHLKIEVQDGHGQWKEVSDGTFTD